MVTYASDLQSLSCLIFFKFFRIVFTARATLCVSAVFAFGRCPSVRLSVRLSHTQYTNASVRVLYPDGLRYCQTSFSARYPIILVFLTPSADTQFQGELHHRGVKYTGGDFRLSTEIAVILGTVRDRLMVAMERYSHRWRIDPYRFQ